MPDAIYVNCVHDVQNSWGNLGLDFRKLESGVTNIEQRDLCAVVGKQVPLETSPRAQKQTFSRGWGSNVGKQSPRPEDGQGNVWVWGLQWGLISV